MTDSKGMLKECLFKEVDTIQGIINRMASNSFKIKSWTITLVVATLLLKGNIWQVYIAFIPLVVFWCVDAYYLRQEKLFRKLYEWVIENRLKTSEHMLDLSTKRFERKVDSIKTIMFSKTFALFYGGIGALIIIYLFGVLHFSKLGGV